MYFSSSSQGNGLDDRISTVMSPCEDCFEMRNLVSFHIRDVESVNERRVVQPRVFRRRGLSNGSDVSVVF